MTELTFVVYPKSGERSIRVRGAMVGWTEERIAEHVREGCRRQPWASTQIDIYRQTPGGWTEVWGEMDLATGEYRRRSR